MEYSYYSTTNETCGLYFVMALSIADVTRSGFVEIIKD